MIKIKNTQITKIRNAKNDNISEFNIICSKF